MPVFLKSGKVLVTNTGKVAVNSACCCCDHTVTYLCTGIMCDTGPGVTSYSSVFNLNPSLITSTWCCDEELHLSGNEGPSDFASLVWYVDIIPDGMGGYSATYGGTVIGRYGGTQGYEYSFSETCGVLRFDEHTDRFCGTGSGNCSDLICGFNIDHVLAFDSGAGFHVVLQIT